MAANGKLWILSSLPRLYFDQLPMFKGLKEDYHVIFWDDLESNPDLYCPKISVFLTAPSVGTMVRLGEDMVKKMTNLKAVSTMSTGLDHLDLPLLKRYGVRVGRNLGPVTADATADLGFCLMLAVARKIQYASFEAQAASNTMDLAGHDVHHTTLGVLGMGHIGFEVARRALGFKMTVLYHNRHRREDDVDVKATFCPTLAEMLPRVDFLVISVLVTNATRNMIGQRELRMMKPTSILVNVSRGEIVKTDDLVDALRSETIAGAGLDVTEPEPLPDHHPLLTMPNVIVTPHIGTFTRGGRNIQFAATVDNVRAALEGRMMPGEFDLQQA